MGYSQPNILSLCSRAAGRVWLSNHLTIGTSDLKTGVSETGPVSVALVWHYRSEWSKNNLQSTTWWDGFLLCAVPKKTAKFFDTSFAGIKPSSLACESSLWECRLWDQNCIKDYFGLRMSLISQVLIVVCRLKDLKFPIISHTNQEAKAFGKSHVKN